MKMIVKEEKGQNMQVRGLSKGLTVQLMKMIMKKEKRKNAEMKMWRNGMIV